MQHLEVSGAVGHIYIYIYVIRRLYRRPNIITIIYMAVKQHNYVDCAPRNYILNKECRQHNVFRCTNSVSNVMLVVIFTLTTPPPLPHFC